MVIIHIAHIDRSIIGGVQIAVPQMVKAQMQYADIGFVNIQGDDIEGIKMLNHGNIMNLTEFFSQFNTPDIVVFHEVYRFEYIRIYKKLSKVKIPYIVVPHGCLSKQAQKRKKMKKVVANCLFFNKFLKSARYIQYLSDNEKNMSAFLKLPYFISGNGIAIPQAKKRFFSSSGVKIVYIGRLEIKTKGLDLLLKAVRECSVFMRKINAKVEIYGPNYGKEHIALLKMIRKYNISDIVSIDKEKIGQEKERILLSADCFIQPSRTEGMPMGLLEALSYGVPCIVTKGVGLGNLIESYGAGYQCETSVKGLAEGLKRFFGEYKEIQSMSIKAVKLIEENFEKDRIAKITVEKYSQI